MMEDKSCGPANLKDRVQPPISVGSKIWEVFTHWKNEKQERIHLNALKDILALTETCIVDNIGESFGSMIDSIAEGGFDSEIEGHKNLFENDINEVNYVLTPEDDGMTLDFMLSDIPHLTNDLLIKGFHSKGYKIIGQPKSIIETGLDEKLLTVIETKMRRNDIVITIVCPIDRVDQYYVTIFVKKPKKYKKKKATPLKANDMTWI